MGRAPVQEWVSAGVAAGDGVTLAAQSLGRVEDPALLLIGAATWSRDWWLDDLCAMLTDRGLRVLRFGPRHG